jgi:hypothetical protein
MGVDHLFSSTDERAAIRFAIAHPKGAGVWGLAIVECGKRHIVMDCLPAENGPVHIWVEGGRAFSRGEHRRTTDITAWAMSEVGG